MTRDDRRPEPQASAISSISNLETRFLHVRDHLYHERECWRLLVTELPTPARAGAQKAGCDRLVLQVQGNRNGRDATPSCREYVLGDHDRYYEPAYRQALEQAIAAGRWGLDNETDDHRKRGKRRAERFVGDNGVVVVVNLVDRRRRRKVSSAYRVPPRGRATGAASNEDFLVAAIGKLRDKTSFDDGGTA